MPVGNACTYTLWTVRYSGICPASLYACPVEVEAVPQWEWRQPTGDGRTTVAPRGHRAVHRWHAVEIVDGEVAAHALCGFPVVTAPVHRWYSTPTAIRCAACSSMMGGWSWLIRR